MYKSVQNVGPQCNSGALSPDFIHRPQVTLTDRKLAMRGKAQRVARPAQTRLQNSGVTRPKFTKFLSDAEGHRRR